jgi:hypothetical protein
MIGGIFDPGSSIAAREGSNSSPLGVSDSNGIKHSSEKVLRCEPALFASDGF